MPELPGSAYRALHRLMVDSFAPGSLERFVKFKLDLRLFEVSSPMKDLPGQVSDVIDHAERTGRVVLLLERLQDAMRPDADLKIEEDRATIEGLIDVARSLDRHRPSLHLAESIEDLARELCYLPDREPQRSGLRDFLAVFQQGRTSRPLLFVLDGGDKESHFKFVEVVAKRLLPEAGLVRPSRAAVVAPGPAVKIRFGEATTFEEYQRHWLRSVSGCLQLALPPEQITPEALVADVERRGAPVVLKAQVLAQMWDRTYRHHLEHWLRCWELLPDLDGHHPLLVFLCVEYMQPAPWKHWLREFFLKRHIIQVPGLCREGTAFRLERLTPVPKPAVVRWVAEDAASHFHTDDLRHHIDELYQEMRNKPIPMRPLARRLREVMLLPGIQK